MARARFPLPSWFAAAILIPLLLSGCGSTPGRGTPAAAPSPVTATPPAPAVSPAPPASPGAAALPIVAPAPVVAPVVDARPATIVGSEESSLMFDSFTVFVAAMDGRPVPAGRSGWNTPLSLPPGPHRLTVEFNRGAFAARTELTFTAAPATAYQLKFASDAEVFGKNSYCEFWIVDTASGEPASPHAHVPLTKVQPPK